VAFQVDAVAGVFAGIAMSLNALLTSLLVPLVATLLLRLSRLQFCCGRPRDLKKLLPGGTPCCRWLAHRSIPACSRLGRIRGRNPKGASRFEQMHKP
jgi:hypothetical protein